MSFATARLLLALVTIGASETSLRSPADFAGTSPNAARAAALFREAARALLHPRCVNCHPNTDSPTQGDALATHEPPVIRGPSDRGVPGMTCTGCHQDHNLQLSRVPGAPQWHLAPRSMAWVGRSVGEVCAQIKDPARNGGKTLQQIVEHIAHNELVAWGWAPGHGRTAAPGTQAQLGALMAAWVEAGAACPEESTP